MTDLLVKILTEVIQGAERLGAFSSSSVWAFFCLVLIAFIFYDKRNQKQSYDNAVEARLAAAKADVLIASSVEKVAEEVKELRYKIEGVNECLIGLRKSQ